MKNLGGIIFNMVIGGAAVAAIVAIRDHYRAPPPLDAKTATFVYACGYVDGQHRIMQVINVPSPHRPASSELCVNARAVAKANGYDPK